VIVIQEIKELYFFYKLSIYSSRTRTEQGEIHESLRQASRGSSCYALHTHGHVLICTRCSYSVPPARSSHMLRLLPRTTPNQDVAPLRSLLTTLPDAAARNVGVAHVAAAYAAAAAASPQNDSASTVCSRREGAGEAVGHMQEAA